MKDLEDVIEELTEHRLEIEKLKEFRPTIEAVANDVKDVRNRMETLEKKLWKLILVLALVGGASQAGVDRVLTAIGLDSTAPTTQQ